MMVKLDVGCGGRGSYLKGFIGIDLWPRPNGKTEQEYIVLDFVKDDLPWAAGSVSEIVAGHIIEHMSREDGLVLLSRCRELLATGGKLTVTNPDLRIMCERYLAGDEKFYSKTYKRTGRDVWPGATLGDRLMSAVTQEGHQRLYDVESLTALAREAGWITTRPIRIGDPYHTRRDHETGIVCYRGVIVCPE